jgi:hypothetical protein
MSGLWLTEDEIKYVVVGPWWLPMRFMPIGFGVSTGAFQAFIIAADIPRQNEWINWFLLGVALLSVALGIGLHVYYRRRVKAIRRRGKQRAQEQAA